ncbi:hypothetical protein [Staphylococcus equorum]|uniref:hypothetical protein n=1 Tax=Staphylococcus equorum TaxID=246432 RepID=UPI0039AF1A9F
MLESRFNTEATQRVTDSINELLDSTGNQPVTAYDIQAQTSVQRSLIGKLRKGQVKLENIAFKNALKLYAYSEEIKKA